MFMGSNDYKKNHNVIVTKYLDPEKVEDDGHLNEEIGYPAPDHPSDHFSIGYEVCLWKNENKR